MKLRMPSFDTLQFDGHFISCRDVCSWIWLLKKRQVCVWSTKNDNDDMVDVVEKWSLQRKTRIANDYKRVNRLLWSGLLLLRSQAWSVKTYPSKYLQRILIRSSFPNDTCSLLEVPSSHQSNNLRRWWTSKKDDVTEKMEDKLHLKRKSTQWRLNCKTGFEKKQQFFKQRLLSFPCLK